MATFKHANGQTIVTAGTRYTITSANGNIHRTADISNWSSNATHWIENDIKSGLYAGFVKVDEEAN